MAVSRQGVAAVILTVVVPLAAGIALLVLGAGSLPASIRAAHGRGVHGTFTGRSVNCGGTWPRERRGDFVSADGRVRLTDVYIVGSRVAVGHHVAAVYPTGGISRTVYPAHGSREWLWDLWLVTAGAAFLAGGVYFAVTARPRKAGSAGMTPRS